MVLHREFVTDFIIIRFDPPILVLNTVRNDKTDK